MVKRKKTNVEAEFWRRDAEARQLLAERIAYVEAKMKEEREQAEKQAGSSESSLASSSRRSTNGRIPPSRSSSRSRGGSGRPRALSSFSPAGTVTSRASPPSTP